METNRRAITALFLVATCIGSLIYFGETITIKLEHKYYGDLDEWVQRGGKAQEYPAGVLGTCEKLVMVAATASDLMTFAISQEEFDFRVSVCAKTTAHRVNQQAEFNDPKLVEEICMDTQIALFRKLCERSNLL